MPGPEQPLLECPLHLKLPPISNYKKKQPQSQIHSNNYEGEIVNSSQPNSTECCQFSILSLTFSRICVHVMAFSLLPMRKQEFGYKISEISKNISDKICRFYYIYIDIISYTRDIITPARNNKSCTRENMMSCAKR